MVLHYKCVHIIVFVQLPINNANLGAGSWTLEGGDSHKVGVCVCVCVCVCVHVCVDVLCSVLCLMKEYLYHSS